MLMTPFASLALALAAAVPAYRQDAVAAAPARGDEVAAVDAALLALVDGGRDLKAARARAQELGREVLVVVTGDRLEGDAALSLQERLVYGVVLADPRVRERLEGRFIVVSIPAERDALRAVTARVFIDDRVVDVPSATKRVHALSSPALAVLGPDGGVARALERLAPVDPGSVAAWLAGAPLRVEVPASDAAGTAYVTAAVRSLAEQPPLMAALAEGEPPSRWALKARARRAHPGLFAAYELLRAPIRERAELDILRESRTRLGEAQQRDGSFPASDALGAPEVTALAALALHLGGAHDAAQRAVEWLTAWGIQDAATRDPLLLTLWLDIQLARYDVGWSRTEEVEAALARLADTALPSGGWAGDARAVGALAARCCVVHAGPEPRATSVHTGFALEALLRAGAQGFSVNPAVVERAGDSLLALRTADGGYADLDLPRASGSGGAASSAGMRGLTLAADAALARLGRLKRKDAVAAIDAYFAELGDQRAHEALGAVGRRHPSETGETRALGWLAYTRLADAAPGRALFRRDGLFRRVVDAGAGVDSTWLDTCDQGWVMATALASIVLDETR